MAQMFPELDELELKELEKKSRAEVAVYRAFRDQTAADWLVLHGLNLIARPPSAPPQDAEADFVVFDSRRGFLVIEVKGGSVTRDPKGRWWSTGRNGKNKIKAPLRQARDNKHQVLASLKSATGWGARGAPRLLMGHAALFPDQNSFTALIGPDCPRQLIGAHPETTQIGAWVDNIFQYWSTNDPNCKPLGKLGMAVVRSVFCAQITVHASLALAIEREQRRQIELTRRQALALQTLRYRSRAAIAGGAGTGKTLLALQHAHALAAQGRRTLLVCYTRALADFLKREAGNAANLEVMQFHQLCDWRASVVKQSTRVDVLAKAAHEYAGQDVYDVQKPYALALSADYDLQPYHAILVDEGQDFGVEYWVPIELLLEDDGQLYVFHDPNQAIYQRVESFPELGPPILLTENCRNTRPVHEAAYRYYIGDEVALPELDGEPIKKLPADGLKAQAKCIRTTVSDLLQFHGLRPEEITVLLVGEHKDEYFRTLYGGGNPSGACWSFEKLWQSGHVLVDTARRFKGLEAAAVILWCADDVDTSVERELLYVALSRARNRLWAVGTPERLEKVLKPS